jgi:hypothetical protein
MTPAAHTGDFRHDNHRRTTAGHRAALYGVLAAIEALGLNLLELRKLTTAAASDHRYEASAASRAGGS